MAVDLAAGLGNSGARLWASFLAQDVALSDEDNPNRLTAINACRAQDRCDVLNEIVQSEGVMLDNGKGQPVTHPAWVELRQLELSVARLTAALRMPDEASGKRPQKRATRGTYTPPVGVSSLDRARAAKTS